MRPHNFRPSSAPDLWTTGPTNDFFSFMHYMFCMICVSMHKKKKVIVGKMLKDFLQATLLLLVMTDWVFFKSLEDTTNASKSSQIWNFIIWICTLYSNKFTNYMSSNFYSMMTFRIKAQSYVTREKS